MDLVILLMIFLKKRFYLKKDKIYLKKDKIKNAWVTENTEIHMNEEYDYDFKVVCLLG